MSDELTPYSDLAVIVESLPLLLREARRARGLTQRDVAEQMGVATSTVCRIEKGEGYHVDSVIALLHWLDTRPQTGGGHE